MAKPIVVGWLLCKHNRQEEVKMLGGGHTSHWDIMGMEQRDIHVTDNLCHPQEKAQQ